MYCPNCANEVNPGLHYCNGCGYKLESGPVSDQSGIAKALAKAVGWIGVCGLLIFVFVLGLLVANSVDTGAVVVVSFFYLGAVFLICAYILKYITSIGSSAGSFKDSTGKQRAQVPASDANQLEPPKTRPASVTDHTTRTLEKVPVDRQS